MLGRFVALKHRVIGEKALELLIELHGRELQQANRLLQLWCQRQMLRDPELERLLHRVVRLSLEYALHLRLKPEILAEIHPANVFVRNDSGRFARREHAPFVDDVGAIADAQSLPNVVVGDQYANRPIP